MIKFTALVLLIVTLPFISFAQTANDIPLKDVNVEYVQIIGTSNLMDDKVKVTLDFGLNTSYFGKKEVKLRDKNGDKLKFDSVIDALNFMDKNGYDFLNAFVVTTTEKVEYHYLMKRKEE